MYLQMIGDLFSPLLPIHCKFIMDENKAKQYYQKQSKFCKLKISFSQYEKYTTVLQCHTFWLFPFFLYIVSFIFYTTEK